MLQEQLDVPAPLQVRAGQERGRQVDLCCTAVVLQQQTHPAGDRNTAICPAYLLMPLRGALVTPVSSYWQEVL